MHHVARVGALRFVATDGHRLARADIGTAEGAETIRPVILSRAFVTEAIKGTSNRRDAFRHVRLAIGADYELSFGQPQHLQTKERKHDQRLQARQRPGGGQAGN